MASSSKFTLLETAHLASQSPSSETTMQNLIDTSERMAEEAKEIMPYSFDECNYTKGYLRQSVWSCLDCGEKGVCYGCSISCHSDHRLVELWVKRSFRCDCPTTSMPPIASTGRRRKCTLNPPEAQPKPVNEENKYNQTFAGRFCRCGRNYDPETEKEAMLNCMICEDWFHESCLNLRADVPSQHETDDEDEDEEAVVLIPSDTYDALICAGCVREHPFVSDRAGRDGWMTIEPNENKVGWKVMGRRVDIEEEESDAGETREISNGLKRSAAENEVEDSPKRRRLDGNEVKGEPTVAPIAHPGAPQARKGNGDVFLAYGVRQQLKLTLGVSRSLSDPSLGDDRQAKTIGSLPFPIEDAEIYEPPRDDDREETLDEVTNRVVGSLPRVQAIEALHGYQNMKDKLTTMLTGHVQTGQTVSREDIETFFAKLKEKKAR